MLTTSMADETPYSEVTPEMKLALTSPKLQSDAQIGIKTII
jgi:hypothetical protein